LPVLFCDAKHGIVGAAHAGWRGLASGVLENTVSAILAETKHDQGNPEHISVWLGPAIGPSYFEVGHEVRDRFVNDDEKASRAFTPHPSLDGKFYADIYQLARLALNKVGVHTIFGGEFCTFSEKEKFYSYRRDGVTGRMATVIWVSGDRWQTTEGKKK
jgi:hypothetical protein